MPDPLSRRRLLAAAVPVALAGCFEQPDDSAGDDGNGETEAPTDTPTATETPAPTPTETPTATPTATPTPERVDPEDAGIAVEETTVRRVSDSNSRRAVEARFRIRNEGRFAYGLLEFRVDAYEVKRGGGTERESMGFAYVEQSWGNPPYSEGTRGFDVTVEFPSSDADRPADPDHYEVDAAVRRAEPA